MKDYDKKLLLGGLLGVLVLTLALSYAFFAMYLHSDESDTSKSDTVSYETEKDDGRENINFTAKSAEIHQIVDQAIQKKQVRLLDTQQERKSVSRRQTVGDFIWDVRALNINMAPEAVEEFAVVLDSMLKKADAKILNRVREQRLDGDRIRFDIGIIDEVDDDTVTIITDKLFIPAAPVSQEKTVKGRIAFIIDDFGYSKNIIAQYRKVDIPLTFAVLPYLPYTAEAAETGYQDGRKIILHMPLEALNSGAREEKVVISSAMSDEEMRTQIVKMLANVPRVIGVNNHQGSKATTDPRLVRILLSVLGERGYFFIDSRTSNRSIAFDTARQLGILTGENRLFIDNKNDVAVIKEKIREAALLASREKAVIAIGHARPATAEALVQMKGELSDMGIEVVFATEILD